MERVWLKEYQSGVPEEIDHGAEDTIVDIFTEAFGKFRNLPAYHNMGKTMLYDDIDRLSLAFATYLQKNLGLNKGDRVAIMMPNLLQYPIALFGVLRAGMTVVNVNPLYTPRELEHQLKDAGAEAIVILENFANTLEQVRDKVPVKHILTTRLGDMLSFPKSLIVNAVVKYVKKMVPAFNLPGAIPFSQALAAGGRDTFDKPSLTPDDLAFLQYTGGTTGVSKGAMLTHRNIASNVKQSRAWIGTDLKEGSEVIVTPLPMYHIFALTANCLVFTSLGALNVLITNPRDIPGFVKELGKHAFTALTGVNTLFNALLNNDEFGRLNFSTLKMTLGGGMAVQRAVAERWQDVTKTPLIEAYGLTETSPAACINPMTLKGYNGFIGLPISSTDIAILDDDGEPFPMGKPGELCVRGPQVMKGYWQRPDETAKVFHDGGWLRTGDIAVMNEDGYFKIVDRKKDMILVSGFNVYPNEVEDVVVTHPDVLEVAAIGVPDPKSTEAVKIFVVRKNKDVTEQELLDYCREHLTGYKRPKHIEFRDELPKTNVGKILRRALRDS